MSVIRPPPPPCEYDRACRELIPGSSAAAGRPQAPCSPEPPELRDYPPAPAGSPPFRLCNGHLSDLFDAQERASHHAATAALA